MLIRPQPILLTFDIRNTAVATVGALVITTTNYVVAWPCTGPSSADQRPFKQAGDSGDPARSNWATRSSLRGTSQAPPTPTPRAGGDRRLVR